MKKLQPGESGRVAVQWRNSDGRWVDAGRKTVGTFRASARYADASGKVRQVSRTATSPHAARAALREHLKTLDAQRPQSLDTQQTIHAAVESFCDDELETLAVATSTARQYRKVLRKYLCNPPDEMKVLVAGLPVASLASPSTNRNLTMEVDRIGGAGAAKMFKSALGHFLQWLYEGGAIPAVPKIRPHRMTNAERIERAQPKHERDHQRALTGIERTNLLRSAEQWASQPADQRKMRSRAMTVELLYFVAYTGSRAGEALALKWEHVDLAGGVVDLPGYKTENAARTLPLHPVLTERLKALRQARGTGYVFGAPAITDGSTAWNYQNARKLWQSDFLDNSTWSWATLHTFRTTTVTLFLDNGAKLRDVADWMGHADVNTTLRFYCGRSSVASSALLSALDEPSVSAEPTPLRALR